MKHFHTFLSVLAVFAITVATSFGESYTPDELVRLYEEQLKSFSHVEFTSSFTDYIFPNKNKTNTLEMNWKIDFAGKRYSKFRANSDGQGYDDISVCDGKTTLSVSVPKPDSGEDEWGVTSYRDMPDHFWNKSVRMLYISWTFGYFADGPEDVSILDVVRHSTKELFFDGEKVGVLCKTSDFEIRILFAPDKSHSVEKIQIKRLRVPKSPAYFESCEYSVRRFDQIDDKWFPVEYDAKSSLPGGRIVYNLPQGLSFASDGEDVKPRTLIASVTLSNVKFPNRFSDSDFQTKEKIPNGTPVYMQDAPQIEYIWMDGKIEPKTDELMLRIARGGHRFMPGPKEPRFWLMAIGLVMILVGGGLKLRQFLNEKS